MTDGATTSRLSGAVVISTATLALFACGDSSPTPFYGPTCPDNTEDVLSDAGTDAPPASPVRPRYTGIQHCSVNRPDGGFDEDSTEVTIAKIEQSTTRMTFRDVTLGNLPGFTCAHLDLEGIVTDNLGSFNLKSPTTCVSDTGTTLYMESGSGNLYYGILDISVQMIDASHDDRFERGVSSNVVRCQINIE